MSNFMLGEKLNKQQLNIMFIIDQSGSMEGSSISAVNHAIRDIISIIPDIESDTADVDILLNVLLFSDGAHWLSQEFIPASQFKWIDLEANGSTNLTACYDELSKKIRRVSSGGMMPDFGGVAPIMILMTDGLPTSQNWQDSLKRLEKVGWYQVALKYALAINIDSPDAHDVLLQFTKNEECILKVFSPQALRKAIQVIAITASKIKSRSASIHQMNQTQNQQAENEISEALSEIDDLDIGW